MKKCLTAITLSVAIFFIFSSVSMAQFERPPYNPTPVRIMRCLDPINCVLPDLIVGVVSVRHAYQNDFYNEKWNVTVAIKNIGGNLGIVEGDETPVYVRMSYFDSHYELNSDGQWILFTQTKYMDADVTWAEVPRAGETKNVFFEYHLRDTGPAGRATFREEIPKYIHVLADYSEGAMPGPVEETDEINNVGGVTVSYYDYNTNEIVTGYPRQQYWWFYNEDF